MAEIKTFRKTGFWIFVAVAAIVLIAAVIISKRGLGMQERGLLINPALRSSCQDSDSGIAPFYKGEVKGILPVSKSRASYTDRCDKDLVVEYYCEEGKIRQAKMACMNGCRAGACLLEPE